MSHEPTQYVLLSSLDESDWTNIWINELGMVGYSFALLEWASFWLADEVGGAGCRKSISNLGFTDRCVYARKKIIPLISDRDLRIEWQQLLKEMERCAAMRNNIAHNPMEIDLGDSTKRGLKVDTGIVLMKQKGRKVLIGEVQHFRSELGELAKRMILLMKRTSLHKLIP